MPLKVLYQFGVRGSSLKAKLILELAEHLGEQVPMSQLYAAVYGQQTGKKAAMARVIEGIEICIKQLRLPYKLVKQRQGKEVSFGLLPNNPSQQERKQVA